MSSPWGDAWVVRRHPEGAPRRGETRVAATPETVKKLIAVGLRRSRSRPAPGRPPPIPTPTTQAAGADDRQDRQGRARQGRHPVQGARPRGRGDRGPEARRHRRRHAQSLSGQGRARRPGQGQGATAFAMEFVPRITRAQVMDVLSSQANLAGYRAVIEAAEAYGRAMPMMMTAAGTVAAGQGVRHGRRRRRPAGHRHRPAAGRGGHRHRRAPRHQGTGREPGRQVHRRRGRGVQERRRPPAATPRR